MAIEGNPFGSGQDGQDNADYTHPTLYGSKNDAQAAANAKKSALDKSTQSLHVEMIGDPTIIAGGIATLVGFRPEIPEQWHITKVTHRYNNSGYITEFDADTKFESGTGADGQPGGGGTGETGTTNPGDVNNQMPLPKGDLNPNENVEPGTASPQPQFDEGDQNSQTQGDLWDGGGTGISIEPDTLPGNQQPPPN